MREPPASLRGADLQGAYLYNADQFANLQGAILDAIDLRDAAVRQAQLDQACGAGVKLDPGLTHQAVLNATWLQGRPLTALEPTDPRRAE